MLIYWLEHSKYENFTSNSLLTPFMNHPNIVFKCLNLTDLARDTPLDLSLNKLGERRLAAIRLLGATGPLWGDLVRMLILYKYGGIYVDVDVILLRPMNPFLVSFA
jgi:mannosyltransferase OCH1-like enzyme